MIIYLDFDGTPVEHDYPHMGRENFGFRDVIKKLQDAGHKIILNTYRANCNDGTLEKALSFLDFHPRFGMTPITEFLPAKIHPPAFNMKEFIKNEAIFIDDSSKGTPLKPAVMTNGQMVDWAKLDIIFEEHGIYNKVK